MQSSLQPVVQGALGSIPDHAPPAPFSSGGGTGTWGTYERGKYIGTVSHLKGTMNTGEVRGGGDTFYSILPKHNPADIEPIGSSFDQTCGFCGTPPLNAAAAPGTMERDMAHGYP
jgi:hypothetical protein